MKSTLIVRILVMLVLGLCAFVPVWAGYQPDLKISDITYNYIGDNIYNTDGADQILTLSDVPGAVLQYCLFVQNDGTTSDSFVVTGPKSSPGWTIKYEYYPLGEITSSVSANGWTTPAIPPGGEGQIIIYIYPDAGLPKDATTDVLLTATSIADPTKKDAVLARAQIRHVSIYRPDIMLKEAHEAYYTGDNIYHGHLSDQAIQHKTAFGTTTKPIIYHIKVQNDGSLSDRFRVVGPSEMEPNWIVHWYDAVSGGNDVTNDIALYGWWRTPILTPGQAVECRIELTPKTDTAGYVSKVVYVESENLMDSNDACRVDDLHFGCHTPLPGVNAKPDGQIKAQAGGIYLGNNLYNTNGSSQTAESAIEPEQTTTYFLDLHDDGFLGGLFAVNGTAGANGWKIKYFNAAYGGNEITGQVTADGWPCGAIHDTFSMEIRVEVTAPVMPTGANETLITLRSLADPTKVDVVKAITTARYLHKPDLWIRNASENTSIGDGVYNVIADQTKSQATGSNQAVTYDATVQNDGNDADQFVLTGYESDSVWTVRYFAGEEEITAAVTGAGWTTPSLAPGEMLPVRVVVTPNSNALLGEAKEVVLMAASVADTAKTDAVKAVTTRAALSLVTLAIVPAAPQLVHTPMTLTATATGGGTIEYKFRVGFQDSAGWHWADISGYQLSPTCTWTPRTMLLYTLLVYAREAGSTAPYQVYSTLTYRVVPALSSVSLTASPAAPRAVNTAITLTAKPVGGLQLEYKFRAGYQDAAGWHWADLTDYTAARTCIWTPSEPRLYTITVYAREQGSTKLYAKFATLSYRITPAAPTAVSLTPTPAAPRPINTPITLTAVATGGTTVEYQFRAGYQDAAGWHWSVVSEYQTTANCTWTPTVPRLYTLAVWAREQGSTAAYQAMAALSYRITTVPITGVTLTPDPASPQPVNTPITLTATPAGGTTVEYKFRVGYQDAAGWHWSELNPGYSTTRSFTWQPAQARLYTVVVWAREQGSTVAYQAYAAISYKVTP